MEFRMRMERMEIWTRMERTEIRTRMERMEIWTRMERMKIWKRISRMERIVRNVCNERNVRIERYIRYERKKRKTGNGNRRWRDSSLLRAAPKIQQLWAIFQRFDINIFNLREHFPPPNFAYSAHNFSLPSPNLN